MCPLLHLRPVPRAIRCKIPAELPGPPVDIRDAPSALAVVRPLSTLLNHKSSQRRLNQASLQLALLPLDPLAAKGAREASVRENGQGPRSDHIHPRRKEGRQARHGRLWLFGSGRRLAPIRTTASQSATPEAERLATSAKPSTRQAEGGAREERRFRSCGPGWRWHPSRQVLPSRQRGSRTSKYSQSFWDIREIRMLPSRHRGYPRLADPHRVTPCVTVPSRVVPLPSSKRGNAKFDLLLDASRVAKPSRLV